MDYIAELKKWGAKVEPDTSRQVKIRCPLPGHMDEHPSCIVRLEATEDGNYEAGTYFCSVCRKGGDFFELLSKIAHVPVGLFKKQYSETGKRVSTKYIETCFAGLHTVRFLSSGSIAAMKELLHRGLSEEIMKKYSLGFDHDEKRITIPVFWGDSIVNVLKYKPGGNPKFVNYAKGYGKLPVLYPQDQLKFDKIVVCGGPVKALAVAQRMNKYGIGAVSPTFGEVTLPQELLGWLTDKERVWVCYDVDATGRKYSDLTCGVIRSHAKWVGNITIPLNMDQYPKGDINDYFGPEKATEEEFLKLLEETPEWEDSIADAILFTDDCEAVKVDALTGYIKPFNFKTTAFLSGVDDSLAHKMPRSIHVSCTGDADVCAICRLSRSAGYEPAKGVTLPIEIRNPVCLSFIGVPHKQRVSAFKEYCGVPEACYKVKFEPSEELHTVRYVLLSDMDSDAETPISAVIFTNGDRLHCGEVCHLQGRVDQSPMDSSEVRIITQHEPKDILSEYRVTDPEKLKIFQTTDDSLRSLEKKIEDINFDLERNVTFIYNRPQVHTLFDLAFHSPLWVPFENDLEPGWISVLLVSETAQGKSTIMRRLLRHYGYGAFIDAANTTIAGLVGGIKTVGKRQFVKWGIIPQNDKRLVCIEEYANAPVELLKAMRAARDSGIVSMNKIDKGQAKARTRTIVLSNPKRIIRTGAIIDGLTLMEDLVERPEDLRRFDAGMWIPRIEMDEWHDSEEPKYSSELCHELITWAWTLQPDQIKFTPEAVTAIRNNEMKKDYPYLYLVGMREFDVKLTRLSAAISARTYNVDTNGCLLVERRHVDWVCTFLRGIYDDIEFGYSSRIRREANMDDSCTTDQIIGAVKLASNPTTLCTFLIEFNRYRVEDLKAACGDMFTFEAVKNKLIILGCFVPEEETRWSNAYLPTRRLKKVLPEVAKAIGAQYKKPEYLKGKENMPI